MVILINIVLFHFIK